MNFIKLTLTTHDEIIVNMSHVCKIIDHDGYRAISFSGIDLPSKVKEPLDKIYKKLCLPVPS